MGDRVQRVAVLGGGMAALTAAYELTRPELDGAFEVTVYQQGWRLGGKGASGRNRHHHNRIEEHGLHVWMGFYENAFRLIRDCYGELGRDPAAPLATWQDAFKPHGYIVLDDVDGAGVGEPWPLCFPETEGTPGDGTPLPSPPEYIPRILELILMLLQSHERTRPAVAQTRTRLSIVTTVENIFVKFESLLTIPTGEGRLAWLGELLEHALQMARHISSALPEQLSDLYGRIARLVELMAEPVRELFGDDDLRHSRLLFDFAVTHLRGLIADKLVLPPFDFSSIDDLDYRAWLRKHGAREETATSAPVTALYDLVFAIDAGMAAGATIACATRMLLTYKGSLFYKMQAGMGDTVFAPLYLVLRQRGVRFKFFHRVDDLRIDRDKASDNFVVSAIVVGRQATVKNGAEYEPLVTVQDLPCWPSEPSWDQLTRGQELADAGELPDGGYDLESPATAWKDELPPLTLLRGEDYDDVVLGISVAALGRITADLKRKVPQYAVMLDGIKTIGTQAMQLWFDTDLAGLGWRDPATGACAGAAPIAGSYAESLDTWADMTHLVGREEWGAGANIRNLTYFCGQLRDAEVPDPAPTTARAWQQQICGASERWMQTYGDTFWPRFVKSRQLDYDLLHSPRQQSGAARWGEQYFRANVHPSERYVLTVPGSTAVRLFADDLVHLRPGCANLFLAGDWVRTGINGGCIEAATMAGMQAARALSGRNFEIVGDTAPFRVRPSIQTAFIERGGDVVYAEPYLQERVRLYSFLLPVDLRRIAALCDRYLNWTDQLRFEPVLGHVALVFAAIESTFSTDPDYIGRGTMSESDVSFWLPVRSSSPSAPSLSWFMPYIWVDNGIAMAAGREVYGFPKEVGKLTIPGAGEPLHLGVDTDVIAAFGVPPAVGPDGPRAVRRTLIKVEPSACAAPAPSFAGSVLEVVRALLPTVLADRAPPDVLDWFLKSFNASVPMLFLKQFRDVGDGRRACYKALVTANSVPSNIRDGGILPGTFDVTINGFASHPIVRELGLGPNPATATIPGCVGFFVDFDFLMERGRELWRAP